MMKTLLKCDNNNVKCVMIKRKPNRLGFISCHYVENGSNKVNIITFRYFNDAVSYFYIECGLTKEINNINSIIMEK